MAEQENKKKPCETSKKRTFSQATGEENDDDGDEKGRHDDGSDIEGEKARDGHFQPTKGDLPNRHALHVSSSSVVVDANPGVNGPTKMVPTVGIVQAKEVKHVVVMGQVAVGHALNGIGSAKHFIVDVALVGKPGHGGDLVLEQVRLEHTSEVVLVLDRVPLEHTTSQHSVAVLVVADDLVNPRDTTGNTAAWCFDDFLENGEVQVVKEPNGDVDGSPVNR